MQRMQDSALWKQMPDLFHTPKQRTSTRRTPGVREPVETRVTMSTWGRLRRLAAGRPIPPERVHAATQAEARAALDEVENWRRALPSDPPPPLPPIDAGPRITTYPDTQTVNLDGRSIRIDDRTAYKLFAAIVAAHNEDRTPIPGKMALAAAGRAVGEDPRPNRTLAQLPTRLKRLKQSKTGPGGGCHLRLPPLGGK